MSYNPGTPDVNEMMRITFDSDGRIIFAEGTRDNSGNRVWMGGHAPTADPVPGNTNHLEDIEVHKDKGQPAAGPHCYFTQGGVTYKIHC